MSLDNSKHAIRLIDFLIYVICKF